MCVSFKREIYLLFVFFFLVRLEVIIFGLRSVQCTGSLDFRKVTNYLRMLASKIVFICTSIANVLGRATR